MSLANVVLRDQAAGMLRALLLLVVFGRVASIAQWKQSGDACSCCDRDWCGCDSCPDCARHLASSRQHPLELSAKGVHFPSLEGLVEDECLQIKPSKISGAGDGLFTTCPLKTGQVLARPYEGEVRREAELKQEVGKVDHSYVWCPEAVAGRETLCYDARNTTGSQNPLRYVNAARSESQCASMSLEMCQLDSRLYFRVAHAAVSGSELLVDYGPYYWGKPQCPGHHVPEKLSKEDARMLRGVLSEAFKK
eukprot:gnl/TRDRNA2_/TRDRNA2_181601_c0_seq1.p1 gnl/TRDRNA2_/TRDRNA2_181601_c0~~gnl/TRDRNA2_/TRDRNA2_181601_c0_seq1.p1  ORF type:complete len:250 (+),score=40.45 gnl/TRDRNA2_/TRDRNA2_181601_c0_seq1:50-799(+)